MSIVPEIEKNYEKELEYLNAVCAMFTNSQHLTRRAELLIIDEAAGDEPIPDFVGVSKTSAFLNSVKPWDVNVPNRSSNWPEKSGSFVCDDEICWIPPK